MAKKTLVMKNGEVEVDLGIIRGYGIGLFFDLNGSWCSNIIELRLLIISLWVCVWYWKRG